MTDKGWTLKKERVVKEWMLTCEQYNHIHEKMKEYYNKKTNRLQLLSILLTTTITIIAGIATAGGDTYALTITSATLAAFSTGLSMYIKSDEPSVKMSSHANVAKGYREIVIKIQLEIAKDPKSREKVNTFMKDVTTHMILLESGEESVPIITKDQLRELTAEVDETTVHNEKNNILKENAIKIEIDTNKDDTHVNNVPTDTGSNVKSINPTKLYNKHKRNKQDVLINMDDVSIDMIDDTKSTSHAKIDNEDAVVDEDTISVDTCDVIPKPSKDGDTDDIGLSIGDKKTFEIFFKKIPKVNNEMLNYQRQRLAYV